MIYIIITSILMSIDLFMMSLLLHSKNVFISIKSILTVILTSSLILFISMHFSTSLKIKGSFCSVISGLLFIVIGIYQMFKNNKNLDLDNSKVLDIKESFILGVLASIDSIVVGISLGLSNYNIFVCLLISAMCNILTLILPKKIKRINYILFKPICSFLFIIIGVIKIINHS